MYQMPHTSILVFFTIKYNVINIIYIYIYNCNILYWAYVLYYRRVEGVPCPPFFFIVAPFCAFFGYFGTASCLLVLACISMCWLRPSSLTCLRDLGGVRDYFGLWISCHDYLKNPTPSYHYGI